MMCIWNFVTDLTIAVRSYLEIKEMVESVYGEKALKKTAI
jgi:hypothetical protein